MFEVFSDVDAIDYFDGLMRFSLPPFILSVLFVAHFLYSLYSRCWRIGTPIDYWHFVVGLGIVVPFFVLLPFSVATPNIISVGAELESIRGSLGDAFGLNLVGYLALLAGTRRQRQLSLRAKRDKLYDAIADRFERAVRRRALPLRMLEASCLLGIFTIFLAYSQFGEVFGIRDQLFQNPVTRVLFNIWYSIYVVAFAIGIIRMIYRPEYYVIALLLIAFACAAVTGSRSMTLLTAVDVLIAALVVFRGRLRWSWVMIPVISLALVVVVTTQLRNADQQEMADDAGNEVAMATLLYGNSLSDQRDFAWVLSAHKSTGEWLLGRSYISAALSFVPRQLSDFREKYSIGTYTNTLLGIDSTFHPGVRGGKFLEPYLNFGALGVALIGWFAGIFLMRTVLHMKRQPATAIGVARAYSGIVPYFVFSQLLISAGFWVVYVFIAVLVLSAPRKVVKLKLLHAGS